MCAIQENVVRSSRVNFGTLSVFKDCRNSAFCLNKYKVSKREQVQSLLRIESTLSLIYYQVNCRVGKRIS